MGFLMGPTEILQGLVKDAQCIRKRVFLAPEVRCMDVEMGRRQSKADLECLREGAAPEQEGQTTRRIQPNLFLGLTTM